MALFSNDDFKMIEEQRQDRFEENVIRRVLRYANVPVPLDAKHQCKDEWQVSYLCLGWFNERFDFPVLLAAKKIRNVHKIQVADLFGSGFMKTPFAKAYADAADTLGYAPTEARMGLVFNWPHIPGAATMVLHNYPIEQDNVPDPSLREERETRILRPFGDPVVTYVIESLNSFLETVGKEWAVGHGD